MWIVLNKIYIGGDLLWTHANQSPLYDSNSKLNLHENFTSRSKTEVLNRFSFLFRILFTVRCATLRMINVIIYNTHSRVFL